MAIFLQDLDQRFPIVDENGKPTDYFLRLLRGQTGELGAAVETVEDALALKADKAITLTAGTGLDGGGDLSANRTFDLADTAVTPDTYGDATNVPQITIDAQGRITAAVDVAISGGGGSGWTTIVSHNFATTPQNTLAADVTGYSQILVVGTGLVHAASVRRGLQVSVDGGANYLNTNGDYSFSDGAGARSTTAYIPAHSTATTAAREASFDILANPSGIFKPAQARQQVIPYVIENTTAAVTHVRLIGGNTTATTGTVTAGNFTAGICSVYAR